MRDTDSDRSLLIITEMRTEQSIESGIDAESIVVHIPIERLIELMEEVFGPSKGTRLRGFGSVKLKAPKVRGSGVAAPSQDSSLRMTLERFEEQQVQLDDTSRELRELKEKHSNGVIECFVTFEQFNYIYVFGLCCLGFILIISFWDMLLI